MTPKILGTFFLSCLLLASTAWPSQTPQPSDDKELPQKVALLVQQLDAEDLSLRDAAELALLELGPRVLPLLPASSAQTSAETQLRLKRLTEKLQNVPTAPSIAPSKVTVQGSMSLVRALKAIADQSGNSISYDNVPDKVIEFDIEDLTFWEALDEVLDEGSLDIDLYGRPDQGVALKPREPSVLLRQFRASYSGPFRIEPIEITSIKSLINPKQNTLRIRAVVEWEPRFQPIYVRFPMQDLQMVLADKSTLSSTEPESAPEFTIPQGSSNVEVEFLLPLPDRKISHVQGLSGKLVSAIPGEKQSLVFEQLDKPTKKQIGNVSVGLEKARKNGGLYEVITLIELKNSGEAMESFRSWVLRNEAFIQDDKGARIENVGSHTYRLDGMQVGIAYLFDLPKNLDQYRFVYEAPGSVSQDSFSFELPEFPLP